MTKPAFQSVLSGAPVIPVVTITAREHAVPLARALIRGGIRAIEITLRTSVALDAIRAIAAEVPDAVLGAGTILSARDFKDAAAAGARFAISPGATPALLDAAKDSALPYLPGTSSASDVMACLERGYDVLKFFPATAAGGIEMLKGLHGPFPNVRFCPTGGISLATAPQFLALPNVICIG